jgi:AraC-like DNA-binding protein
VKAALRVIELPDDASLNCRWRCESRFEFHWHYHPEYQLELLIRGKERLFVGDRVLDFGPGELLLLGPYLPHSMLTENEACLDNPEQESVIVQFPEESLGSDFLQRPELRRVQKLLERSRRGLIYSADHCRSVFDRVSSLPERSPFERLHELVWILNALAEGGAGEPLASETYQSSSSETSQTEYAQINIVSEYIQKHLADEITESEVAKLIYHSTSGFSRFFRRVTGMTFVDYVNGIRIGRACRRLIESEDSVLDICLEVGFGNKSNFNRQFKRRKGMTPSLFRKTFRPQGGA